MRTVLTLLLVFACAQAALADTRLVMVDGYCYLEGQSEHSETKVKFIKDSPSAVTDSTYTDSSGYFTMSSLYAGIYDVEYTHDGFDTVVVENQLLVGSTTLPPVTLERLPLSGALSGVLGPGSFNVGGDIWVNAGDSLRLLPGTTFIFDGPYLFEIFGTLLAEGTESDSVVFTTDQSGGNRWTGFDFDPGSDGSQLSYCVIEKGNAVNDGGGIYCNCASPTFTHCSIRQNSSGANGGGVDSYGTPSPSFTNCTITRNSSGENGGGVYCSASSPVFTNCIISENSATSCDGGGVFCHNNSAPTFTDCAITENSAGRHGGGLYCYSSLPTFVSCALNGNSAGHTGGGIFCYNNSSACFVNCTIAVNSANVNSGGLWCGSSSPSLINCNLIGNSSTEGVYCNQASPMFRGCIIAFSSGSGIEFYNSSSSQISYCDIFGNSGGNFVGNGPPGIGQIVTNNANGDSCDVYHNIFLNPMFADTTTGDFHLLDNSHCIGAGNPADTVSSDFEGDPRPNPPGSNPDIGADENPNAQPPCELVGSQTGTRGPGICHVIGDIWVDAGDSLRILPGTTFIFDGPYPFQIYGTLLAEGTESDSIVFTTEQSGSNRWRGLRFQDSTSSGSRLAYCVIEKGYATGDRPDNSGGGVYCYDSSPTFTNCTLSGNSAGWDGGGVCCESYSAPTFTNCTLSGNSAGYGGGVSCIYSSSPTFTNCTMGGNLASDRGGGVCCFLSAPVLTNCTISSNSSIEGGGVYCTSSSPTFTNCTLSGNSASYASGVYCWESLPTFNSMIIAFSGGVGIYFYGSAGSRISYCDIFGNSGAKFEFYNNDPSQGPPAIGQLFVTNANHDSCDIYKNIFLAPIFADTAARDFHLTDFSHCLGAGDPEDTVSTDFEGDPRPNPSWSFPDIGADEHWSGSPVLHLVVSMSSGSAKLHWTPFGAGPYSIYGATEPNTVGTLLATVSDTTTWTDEETASHPWRYFYYVTAGE